MTTPTIATPVKFRLTANVVSIIKGNKELKNEITNLLGITDEATRRYLNLNSSNGILTTVVVTNAIAASTGLSVDQILENESSNN